MNGCNKCPAYGKCTVTYRGASCRAVRYSYGVESDPEIMSNADRIRAMSDEELAQFLQEPFCDKRTHEECTISYCAVCDKCVLDWLQEPAKEDE